MVFSSLVFLFLYLPVVLTVYAAMRKELRNLFLVIASMVFYAWGEGPYLLILLASILSNYLLGLVIDAARKRWLARFLMGGAVSLNITLLGFFKYSNFFAENLNVILKPLGLSPVSLPPIHLPIGISFYTFHALSYLIDVYRHSVRAQKNLFHFMLYVSMFPKLIQGPIAPYHDLVDQLSRPSMSVDGFLTGMKRFIIGLGKKTLVADTLAVTADQIFFLSPTNLSPGLAWLGAICYTLQIYVDFAGYSDMAIGLGHMFGFRLPENFNYPYVSASIREFWRRWHISLSAWFRDYLYIPLGGSRRSPLRTYCNLFAVFFLCGLWHGASWNFILWGVLHGAFILLEHTRCGKWIDRTWGPLKHLYALSIVIIAWVFFRSDNLPRAIGFLSVMFGLTKLEGSRYFFSMYMNPELVLTIAAGVALAMPLKSMLRQCMERFGVGLGPGAHASLVYGFRALAVVSLAVVLVASVMALSMGTYNPFIYFRF